MREQIIDLQSHRRSHTGDRPGIARIHGPLDLHNLVGDVDQVRDIDRAVLLKKCVTVVFGASTPLFDAQFGKDGFGYRQRWMATKELTEPARTFSLEEVGAAQE